MFILPLLFLALAATIIPIHSLPINQAPFSSSNTTLSTSENCFPSLDDAFLMPAITPSSTDNWWCNMKDEYGFVGFSYEVTECQSLAKLKSEFEDIRMRFHGRYVRLYGFCDRKGFYDDIVEAAWTARLGIHALIWFGWDGGDEWKGRRDVLLHTLHNNPKARFITRVVQFGSEPLFDSAIESKKLAKEVQAAKENLRDTGILVTVSDMAFGFQKHGGAQEVLDSLDVIDAHMLPFFSQKASSASEAWPIVESDMTWFLDRAKGKKIYLSENGWPSKTYSGVEPNSPDAVADIANEKDYYTLLDDHCNYFKTLPGGGVGWFAHLYSDTQEPGYGIVGDDGKLKFDFQPKTSC